MDVIHLTVYGLSFLYLLHRTSRIPHYLTQSASKDELGRKKGVVGE